MTPEQKFKQWALSEDCGYWNSNPYEQNHPDQQECRAWDEVKAAFLAGMEADRWISVEERLPEVPNVYLVSDENGYMEVTGFDGEFFPPEEWSESDIKFWQPLPKPPKP